MGEELEDEKAIESSMDFSLEPLMDFSLKPTMDFSLELIRLPTVFSAVFKKAKEKWVADTRANRHACCNWNLFESIDVIQRLPKVMTARGIVIALGIRTVRL